MRNLCVCLAVSLLVIGVVQPNDVVAAPVLSIQPSESVVWVGNTVDVSVTITDVPDLYAFQFDVNFDPTVVKLLSVSEGSFWPLTGNFLPGFDGGPGTVAFIADALNGSASAGGSGTLAVISFLALSQGMTALNLSNVILLDSSFADVVAEVRGANLQAVPEPSSVLFVLLSLGAPLLKRRRTP